MAYNALINTIIFCPMSEHPPRNSELLTSVEIQSVENELKAELKSIGSEDREALLNWIAKYENAYIPALIAFGGEIMPTPVFEASNRALAWAYVDILRELVSDELPTPDWRMKANNLRRRAEN